MFKETSIVFCVFMLCVPALSVPFQECNGEYMVNSVDIPGCKNLPCPLMANSDQIVNVNMTASLASRTLTQKVYIVMSNVHNPIATTPEPCTSQWKCPVTLGEDASYSAKIHVPNFPEYYAFLQWELFNEKNIKVMCFKVRIEICHTQKMCDFINNKG